MCCLRYPVPVLRRADKFPHFDICIIGGGPGGIAAAMRAASHNKKVCIVEAKRLGGADIWAGTIQSKALWEMAKFASKMTDRHGLAECVLEEDMLGKIKAAVNPERIQAALWKLSETREAQVRDFVLSSGIALITGKATFASEKEIDVHTEGTGEYRALTADYFIIATGSNPRQQSMCPTDGKRVITSNEIFEVPIPKSLIIVGSGRMGCEFASMFAHLGKTKVFMVDRAVRILPKLDVDVAEHVSSHLAERGVTIYQNCRLLDLEVVDGGDGLGGCQYTVQNATTGVVETGLVERTLVTVGRRPNYTGLGLENTKMRVRNGRLQLDEYHRCTPYNHIYCIGDASGDRGVVNIAQTVARAVVEDIYSLKARRVVDSTTVNNFASVTFLEEEVSSIGLSEKDCREQKISYIASKFNHSVLARATILGETDGFVKMIVTNDGRKTVLGVHAVGNQATSVVEAASLAVRNRLSVYEFLKNNPGYPSMVLGLVECARLTIGRGSWQSMSRATAEGPGAFVKQWHPEARERGRAYCEPEDVGAA